MVLDHPVWSTVEEFRNAVSNTLAAAESQGALDAPAGEDSESLVRLSHGLEYIEGTLKASDPILVPLGTLDTITSHLSKALSLFHQHKPGGTALQNAITAFDSALLMAVRLPSVETPTDVEGVREAVGTLRRSAGQHLANLEREATEANRVAQEAQSRLSQVLVDIESQKGRLDQAIATFQSQFSDGENKRANEHQTALKEARASLNTEIDEVRETAEELRLQTKKEITTVVETGREEIDATIKELADTVARAEESLRERGEITLQQLEALKEEVERLVAVTGGTALAGSYQDVANRARKRVTLWNLGAMAGILGFILIAIIQVTSPTEALTAVNMASRFALASAFALLVGYSSRQVAKNEETESTNRRMQLELASLNPYMANMPDEIVHQLKAELAGKMFGRDGVSTRRGVRRERKESDDGDFSLVVPKELLGPLGELLSSLRRGASN